MSFLPGTNYQLERRVDIFISFLLPEIVRSSFLLDSDSKLEVIPEFPLHKGKVLDETCAERKNESIKVDFALISTADEAEKRLFLVELKTDNDSISNTQIENLHKAVKKSPSEILHGICECARNSEQKRKYAHLIWQLYKIGAIDGGAELRDLCLSKKGVRLGPAFRNNIDVHSDWMAANGTSALLIYPGGQSLFQTTKNKMKLAQNFCSGSQCKSVDFEELRTKLSGHPLSDLFSYVHQYYSHEPGTLRLT